MVGFVPENNNVVHLSIVCRSDKFVHLRKVIHMASCLNGGFRTFPHSLLIENS